MSAPGLTPAQTVGPFFAIGMPELAPVAADAPGAVRVWGHVLDGGGDPVADAVVETWQPEPPVFARAGTDPDGRWEVRTLPPRPPEGAAPHLAVSVHARGLLHRVVTRVYFADREAENAADPVLRAVPADRRATLLAQPDAHGYRLDIRLQGPGETVFFAI